MINPRKAAVEILLKIEKESAYSNLTLAAFFKEKQVENQDKAFISALVYGVLDRRITLDFVLGRFLKSPLKKTAPFTLNVLRCAVYQIMFMDKIPESAAVNEAVKLIKKSRESRNAGFVNAVLRAVIRSNKLLPEDNSVPSLSAVYSAPEWLVETFITDYGVDTARKLLDESLKVPPVTLKANTVKTDSEALKTVLVKQGISVYDSGFKNALNIEKGIDISHNKCFQDGLFHIEDLASQKAIEVLAPKENERVLDLCAAPGGKTFTMAELMQNKGEIIACDLYEHRANLIGDGAKRLGLDIIKPMVADATVYDENLGEFECILCDVPCSGLGVIRRKPDIKYKPQSDFEELEEIQYKILCNAVKYLTKGGRILYSTCTLRKAENENIVEKFLKENDDFYCETQKTLMPHEDNTDGFYYALLKQK